MIKTKNQGKRQKKPKINITTKEPSRKQIIISMAKFNTELTINSANQQVTNINKSLKSDIIVDFIYIINDEVIVTTCQS